MDGWKWRGIKVGHRMCVIVCVSREGGGELRREGKHGNGARDD